MKTKNRHESTTMTARNSTWKASLARLGTLAMVLGVSASLALGCGDDKKKKEKITPDPEPPPSAEVKVNVKYEDDALITMISSLHVWILSPRDADKDGGAQAYAIDEDDPPKLVCQNLMAGLVDPYDLVWEQRGDAISGDAEGPVKAENVTLGKGLVYVQAINFLGDPELAGCEDIDVEEPDTSVTVDLSKAGVSDCEDPEAEDGAPCDDGLNCTVGETCKKGKCQGGEKRDCTHVADSCNAESCDEDEGCVPVPLDNDTPCDDDLFCTDNDLCTDGVCQGSPRDCDAEAGECEVALTCNETLDRCEFQTAPNNTPCDDGLFCTENDFCNFGTCYGGSARDCSGNSGLCYQGECNEDTDECEAVPSLNGTFCNDNNVCTLSERCDGAGNCVGISFASNATICNDGNPCTATDYCDGAGTCVPGTQYPPGTNCNDGNDCTTISGTCQADGTCLAVSNHPAGTVCTDTETCTSSSRCDGAGSCIGFTYVAEGTSCNDNDPDTGGDACNDMGMCVGN